MSAGSLTVHSTHRMSRRRLHGFCRPRRLDDIDFDDLTSPELTDVQRQILQFTEAKHVEFDIDQMLAEAIDQAGGQTTWTTPTASASAWPPTWPRSKPTKA